MAIIVMVTDSFGIGIEAERLRVVTDHGLLLVSGEVAVSTAAALRALADECDRVLPPPALSAQYDLFDVPRGNVTCSAPITPPPRKPIG